MSKSQVVNTPEVDQYSQLKKYPQEDIQRFLEQYANTPDGFRATCEAMGYECSRIWKTINTDKTLKGLYQQARIGKADLIADQTLEDANNDIRDPRHNANRIKTKQWLASCYDSETYGHKVEMNHIVEPVSIQIPSPTTSPTTHTSPDGGIQKPTFDTVKQGEGKAGE